MSKLKQIFDGWKNYTFENKEVETEAKRKAKICGKCPHAIEDKWFDLVDSKITELSGLSCELCDCPLSTLTRSPTKKCEANKF